ncbi:hypothetical protein RFEPED_0211 [Rickettsia felis str. Pedreira]|uniref:Uncharacterized protein n=1 Tax=Rickettsia felis str. Pedreira TaxID=1359196 RepID=A0A0F3MTC8_RICFI|nr:hypothetical protein RFEPED_0211 [Rickettsia felis str. Pedreira]
MREELRSNQGEAISGYLTRLPRRFAPRNDENISIVIIVNKN